MTKAEFIKRVALNTGYTTDNENVLATVETRAMGVMEFINKGGGRLSIETLTDYEILCISLGVADMLNQQGAEYSPGFIAMSQQLQLSGSDEE